MREQAKERTYLYWEQRVEVCRPGVTNVTSKIGRSGYVERPREPRLTNNTSDRKANGEIGFLACWRSMCGEADAGMPDPNTIKR